MKEVYHSFVGRHSTFDPRFSYDRLVFKKIIFIVLTISAVIVLPPLWYLTHLPDTTSLRRHNPSTTAIRVLREEQIRLRGGKPHSAMEWRNLQQISPYLRHAVILAEDDTFFSHQGFDIEQMKRAAQINWQKKRYVFGASTITQQLARTLYLSSEKNLLRKIKEAIITRRLEKTLSKNRILELYLNVVEWGPQVYGAEAASQHFFNKAAADLSVDEAISLAVILPSPRRYNPLSDKGYIANRKIDLYNEMVRAHYYVPIISTDNATIPLVPIENQAPDPTQNPF